MEKILSYPRTAVAAYDGVAQQHSWDCGPATAQIILAACGIYVDEQTLINKIGTTVRGTNHSGLIAAVLNQYLPGSEYTAIWLTKEPVPQAQIESLWKNIKRSVDAGRGAVLNFVAPPSNFPRGSNGSVSPEYRGWNTIYHYVAAMGYDVDSKGRRHIWVADPGFRPFGYFITLEQCATLIVPHSYAYAADAPILPDKVETKPTTPIIAAPDKFGQLWLEWNAVEYGDQSAIEQIVKLAQSGDKRNQTVLAHLERINPTALKTFIESKGK